MNVGRRLAEIFGDDEPTANPPGRVTELEDDGKVFPYTFDRGPIEPQLPVEIADRIRDLIRAGDLSGAAELAGEVLDVVGVGRAEPGVTGGLPGGQEVDDRE